MLELSIAKLSQLVTLLSGSGCDSQEQRPVSPTGREWTSSRPGAYLPYSSHHPSRGSRSSAIKFHLIHQSLTLEIVRFLAVDRRSSHVLRSVKLSVSTGYLPPWLMLRDTLFRLSWLPPRRAAAFDGVYVLTKG